MNHRERFLAACRCEEVDRPPVWVMRQAGRYLPEYRELKKTHTFHQLVQTPEKAREVTLQPLKRFDLDAAIIFSDILVIPEALGQPYHFRDIGGIEMEFRLEEDADVEKLSTTGVEDRLSYVADAIKLTREAVGEDRALIGFGGSPWTLATYMIEGESSKTYSRSRRWYYMHNERFEALCDKITDALIAYFEMQIEAGVDVLQIFDSWGGVLAPDVYHEASMKWVKRIIDAIGGRVPIILFSKGMHEHTEAQVETGANVLGVTWTASLRGVRDALPDHVGVQGNLDPVLMSTTPELVEAHTRRILEEMRGVRGHIFNLGHGIQPDAKPECMARLVETVSSFS